MRWSTIQIRGPLAPYLPGLWQALAAQGYTALSIRNLARLLAHLSRWLADHRLTPSRLDRGTIRTLCARPSPRRVHGSAMGE